MTIRIIAAAALAFAASVAAAQETPQEQAPAPTPSVDAVDAVDAFDAVDAVTEPLADAPAPAAEPDPGEEMVCRTERVTGSLTRRTRTCMTRNEWNGVESRTRDAHNRLTRGASGGQCIPSDAQSGRC